jgi:predicted acetyltransferase
MDQITVRPIQSKSELTEVLDLLGSVFPEERSFFKNRLTCDSSYKLDTTWVALVNGRVSSTVQIFPFEVRIKKAKIKVAGVGNVAALPEFRGMGLSKKILLQQMEWMKDNHFPLSLLYTGIHSFYEKLGWVTVPVSVYRFKREDIAGVTGDKDRYEVRPFAKGDIEAAAAIYDSFNENRTGARVRTVAYWHDQICWRAEKKESFLLAKTKERTVAYIRHYIDGDGVLQVPELCYVPGEESAALFLVKEAVWGQPGVKEVNGHFPANHALLRQMEERWETSADREAMWNVIDETALRQAVGGGRIDAEEALTLLGEPSSIFWPMDKF